MARHTLVDMLSLLVKSLEFSLICNGQETAHIRNVLRDVVHEQVEPTQMTPDNSTADGFANRRTKIRRSKAMDKRFYWIQD